MKRIALVVQRCHESIVGGSEALAWQYATLLRSEFEVDILTSTALDHITWNSVLPAGWERRDGINIGRFEVTVTRTPYWHQLFERLMRAFHRSPHEWLEDEPRIPWTMALQEEFIRYQGPYCQDLIAYIRDRAEDYHAILFSTYLYPTTYFCVPYVPRDKAILVPTLHDEPTAYLSVYKSMAHQVGSVIWLTGAERKIGQMLWGDLPGSIVAMAIDTTPRKPYCPDFPYVLYSGRIEPSKGCHDLISFFLRFKKEYPSDLRLILTGKDNMPIPKHPDIVFRGFVSDEEKFELMAGAEVFIMPSAYESFSIVTLEAMAQGTPVLANATCQVLVEHITRSQGGEVYTDYSSFGQALRALLSQSKSAVTNPMTGTVTSSARAYVLEHYTAQSVQQQLIEAVSRPNLYAEPLATS